MRFSIRFKTVVIIILTLLLGVTGALYFALSNQRNNLLEAARNTLSMNNEILNSVIKSIMLQGEAPIAQTTMNNLKELSNFKEIAIYRKDGSIAFNDFETLDFVNEYQDFADFKKTPRVKKSIIESPDFREVIEKKTPSLKELSETREVEYFFPILNHAECRSCHGTDHYIRGVSHFKISIEGIYEQIGFARLVLSMLFFVMAFILSIILIFVIQSLVLSPLLKIGRTVKIVGTGNLDAKIELATNDEISDLGDQINSMIEGLKEKNKLLIENKVIEARNKENKKYLDNIQEGLLLIQKDLTISNQYSSFLREMFQTDNIAGKSFIDFIYPDQDKTEERQELEKLIKMIFKHVSADMEMIMEVNPLKDKTLQVAYTAEGSEKIKNIVIDAVFHRIMKEKEVENIMVIFEDKTGIVEVQKELELERRRSESEIEHIAAILKAGPESFVEFVDDADLIIQNIEDNLSKLNDPDIIKSLFRSLHSLKGTARYLEFKHIGQMLHETETIIARIREKKKKPDAAVLNQINVHLSAIREEVEGVKTLNERFKDFSIAIGSAADAGPEKQIADFFTTLEKMTGRISAELSKKVQFLGNNETAGFPYLKELKNSIIHLVRNALDHAIEEPLERISVNKEEAGRISLTFKEDPDGTYRIELLDDGRGIDFDGVYKKALEQKLLLPDEQADNTRLLQILFSHSFSSKDEVSDLSGRGVGLDVVKDTVSQLGGRISVTTSKGVGTKFTIVLPAVR